MQSIMNLLQPPPSTYEPLDESGKLRKTTLSGRAFIVTGQPPYHCIQPSSDRGD